MTTEFILSNKKRYLGTGQQEDDIIYKQRDIKEFIKILKSKIQSFDDFSNGQKYGLNFTIDQLIGDDLK